MIFLQSLLIGLAFVGGLVLCLLMWIFLRALSVKLMTGKWPHQCKRAQAVYRNLP